MKLLALFFPMNYYPHMDMKTYVKTELEARAGELAAISRATGVSRRAIGYFLEGRDIRLSTLEALNTHLKSHRRKRKD